MIRKLLDQIRTNQRLRFGLVLILAIFWVDRLLAWRDVVVAQTHSLRALVNRESRLDMLQKEQAWPVRLDEAREQLARQAEKHWQSESLGLARANLQDWLSSRAMSAKVVAPKVSLADTESSAAKEIGTGLVRPPEGYRLIRAAVEGNFDPQVLTDLLTGLSTGEHRVYVESLVVKRPRFNLTVAAYVRLPEDKKDKREPS